MLKYFVFFSFCIIASKSVLEMGEFDVKITQFETYKGPKRRNCVESVTKIVNDSILDMDFHVKENMKIIKGRIIGWINNKELLRVQMKNLCDHIFFKPLIQGLFNISDHCAIEKGQYHLYVDIQSITRSFYGGKFIYGNWKFNWIFYNDVCNLQSGNMNLSMTPKGFVMGEKTK